jgi:hypothetical protein
VGANPLRHPNHEWEDGGWQVKPPSPESRVGGWWLAGKASHTRFERGRVGANPLRHSNREWEGGDWQVKSPTRISSEGGGASGCCEQGQWGFRWVTVNPLTNQC